MPCLPVISTFTDRHQRRQRYVREDTYLQYYTSHTQQQDQQLDQQLEQQQDQQQQDQQQQHQGQCSCNTGDNCLAGRLSLIRIDRQDTDTRAHTHTHTQTHTLSLTLSHTQAHYMPGYTHTWLPLHCPSHTIFGFRFPPPVGQSPTRSPIVMGLSQKHIHMPLP